MTPSTASCIPVGRVFRTITGVVDHPVRRIQSHLSRLQIQTSRFQIQTSKLPSWARNLEAFMASLSSLRPDGTQVTVPVPALLFAHSGIDSSMLSNDLFDERPKMLRRPKHNV